MTGHQGDHPAPLLPVPAGLAWLGVVRHGQSRANAQSDEAHAAGRAETGVVERDADVPLTDRGREEARLVGAWLAGLPADQTPELIVVSPYRRCQETIRLALAAAATTSDLPGRAEIVTDERVRDNEVGVLEGLTARGVRERFGEEADRKRRLGPFYYRPPGGESWADVALRLRSLLGDLNTYAADRRVLWVAHDLTARLTRYLFQGLSEQELRHASATDPVPNASLTTWLRRGDRYELTERHTVEHLTRHRPAS
ncbi:MAG: histidine phosphatase family protein [Actinocatenispora sp.]